MKKKYSIRDFLYILTACYVDIEVGDISFKELELIGNIMKLVPEFSKLNSLFDLDCSFEEFEEICSMCGSYDEEKLYFNPKFDCKKVLEEFNEHIDLFDSLLFAYEYLESISAGEKCTCAFYFDSPDTTYEIGCYNNGLEKQEEVLFTDGDVVTLDESKDKNKMATKVNRKVEVINSSYSIVYAKAGEQKALSIRSDYLSDGYLTHEIDNILNDRVDHYKNMYEDKPKVYRLFKQ